MRFINFKGWQTLNAKQTADFIADKGKYLATHHHTLTSADLADPQQQVPYVKFRAGYIVNDANELCIDIDNNKDAEKRVAELLTHYKIDFRAQRTKKGVHIWLLIPSELVPSAKKCKFYGGDLMFAGAWVFGGKELEFYYLPFKDKDLSQPLIASPRAADFLAELMERPSNLPFKAKKGGDALKNDAIAADFVKECVENLFDDDLFYSGFWEHFGYHLANEGADVSVFTQEHKPLRVTNRNNILNRIRFDLCRNVAATNIAHIHSFLRLVNERVFAEPLDDDELERSFSLKRIEGENHTLKDYENKLVKAALSADDRAQLIAEQETYELGAIQKTDLFINIDPDPKEPAVYRYDELNDEAVLVAVRNTPLALNSEILRDPILRAKYIVREEGKKTKQGEQKPAKMIIKKPELRIIVDKQLSSRVGVPQIEVKPRRADIKFNYAGTHFNKKLSQPQIWSDDEFDRSTFARFARERLFESEEHFALFCHHLRERMRGAPLSKAFLMLGAEGIGKDTFVEFLAHSLFRKYDNRDYRKAAQYKRSFSEFVADKWAGRYTSLILNLNEAGNNYVFGSQSVEQLKSIIGNTSASGEEKGKGMRNYEIAALFCIISTNRPAVDLDGVNNDRIFVNYCPATDSLRNNPALINMWFGGKSVEDIAEDEGGEFVNYIYHTDRFAKIAAQIQQQAPTFALKARVIDDNEDEDSITIKNLDVEREILQIANLCENPPKLKAYLIENYENPERRGYNRVENKDFHAFALTFLKRLKGNDSYDRADEVCGWLEIPRLNPQVCYQSDRLMAKLIKAVMHFWDETGQLKGDRSRKHYKQLIENTIGVQFRAYLPPRKVIALKGVKDDTETTPN